MDREAIRHYGRTVHGLEPETEIDLGLGSAASGASEIGSAVGAAGRLSPDALLIEHVAVGRDLAALPPRASSR